MIKCGKRDLACLIVLCLPVILVFRVYQNNMSMIIAERLKGSHLENSTVQGESPTKDQQTISENVLAWLTEQNARKRRVTKKCTSFGQPQLSKEKEIETILNDGRMLANLWASKDQKVIYCPLGKVVCSSWRKIFLQLSPLFNMSEFDRDPKIVHDFNLLAKHGLKTLGQYSRDDAKLMLETFPKFMVVRHPYARLLSAFNDKFTAVRGKWNQVYTRVWGAKIIRRTWENPSQEALKSGRNITLVDFLRYISDKDRAARDDPHWAPFYEYCFPCHIKYDYVLKQETMQEDSKHILTRVFNTSLKLDSENQVGKTKLDRFNDVPEQYMEGLFKVYKKDFELYEYSF